MIRRLKLKSSLSLTALFLLNFFVAEMVLPSFIFAQTTEEQKTELRQQLQELQAQIDAYREKILDAGAQEQDLKGQISVL
jgi:peptidoglycan hydrolase CwlO-like protein